MTEGLERRAKGTVLVVDDSAVICEFLRDLLGQHGYETVVATNGVIGLQQFDSKPIDVVIADIFMPEMDGLTLLEHIKHRSPDTPVVLLTAWPSMEETVRALSLGASEVFTKPVSPPADPGGCGSLVLRLLCVSCACAAHPIRVGLPGLPWKEDVWRSVLPSTAWYTRSTTGTACPTVQILSFTPVDFPYATPLVSHPDAVIAGGGR